MFGASFLLFSFALAVFGKASVAKVTVPATVCSTKLLALVAKHSSKLGVSLAYPQHCGRVGHRHFFSREFQEIETLFFVCHSIFVKSLARFAFDFSPYGRRPSVRHPRGINFVYATRDQWLQNSPITKLCFVILTTGRI